MKRLTIEAVVTRSEVQYVNLASDAKFIIKENIQPDSTRTNIILNIRKTLDSFNMSKATMLNFLAIALTREVERTEEGLIPPIVNDLESEEE